MKGAIMEEKKYTADGMNIEVDKYEDKKIRERRIMAYAFKMIREESGMNRKDFADVYVNRKFGQPLIEN